SSGDEQVEAAATLSTSLARQLTQGAYECMICCDSVRARQAVWQCDRCWAIFHLGCVQRWASASTGAGTGADGGRWRCPGCQHARAAAPTHYVCFCGATRNPPMARRGAVPHACGQTCGRRRGAHCPHACTQACHPGPCPPCTALAPEQACFCGRTVFRQRCGASYDPADGGQSCGAPCGETLGCGRHTCTQPCHGGLCAACPRTVTQRCHCGRHQRQAACGASPSYDCGEACEALLACGVHTCGRTCHPTDDGSHEVCALDPATAATCHCGAQSAAALGAPRASCADPVPSCGAPCGRRRADCDHPCPAPCHAGECPPCAAAVRKPCRCGAETAA
ncbi:FKBP12-associated protein, partial [Coemansia sp. RSA 2703]